MITLGKACGLWLARDAETLQVLRCAFTLSLTSLSGLSSVQTQCIDSRAIVIVISCGIYRWCLRRVLCAGSFPHKIQCQAVRALEIAITALDRRSQSPRATRSTHRDIVFRSEQHGGTTRPPKPNPRPASRCPPTPVPGAAPRRGSADLRTSASTPWNAAWNNSSKRFFASRRRSFASAGSWTNCRTAIGSS